MDLMVGKVMVDSFALLVEGKQTQVNSQAALEK